MSDLNRVLLLGNLGSDPEVRYMANGNAVANFSLATNRRWKKDGEKNEEVEWHRVVAFGKTAELLGEYTQKGSRILVEGRLKTRKWEGKDGQTRWTTEIVVEQMGFQGRAEGEGSGSRPKERHQPQSQPQQQSMGGVPDDFDDDIPF